MTCWIQDNFYFNLPILHLYTLHSAVAIHPSLYSLCRKGLCLVILSLHLFSFFCADFSQVGWLAQICFISSGPSVRPSLWREERRERKSFCIFRPYHIRLLSFLSLISTLRSKHSPLSYAVFSPAEVLKYKISRVALCFYSWISVAGYSSLLYNGIIRLLNPSCLIHISEVIWSVVGIMPLLSWSLILWNTLSAPTAGAG